MRPATLPPAVAFVVLGLVSPGAPAAPAAVPTAYNLPPVTMGSAPTRLQLDDPLAATFGWNRYATPAIERLSESRASRGQWGVGSWKVVPELSLSGAPMEAREPVAASAPLLALPVGGLSLDLIELMAPPRQKSCAKRAVSLVRYGGEHDTFSLSSCEGALQPDALDRLSVLARPPGAARPPLPLPDEPDPVALDLGEWVPSVRLLNPRLVWAVQRVAEAFPRRTIYVMSGYRRGGHDGLHGQGRAMDLFVMNVDNERVYKFCRTLPDTGCGYYPNNKFVHIDIRRPGTGKAFWIDTSAPSEPSTYVDGWPGVETSGAAVWQQSSGKP